MIELKACKFTFLMDKNGFYFFFQITKWFILIISLYQTFFIYFKVDFKQIILRSLDVWFKMKGCFLIVESTVLLEW